MHFGAAVAVTAIFQSISLELQLDVVLEKHEPVERRSRVMKFGVKMLDVVKLLKKVDDIVAVSETFQKRVLVLLPGLELALALALGHGLVHGLVLEL